MKSKLLMLLFFSFYALPSFAILKATDFQSSQLNFDFIASDGSFWYDCTHKPGLEPHDWIVKCDRFEFHLHLFLQQFQRADESTFEFHYWADEVAVLKETHTQSTWITVDKKTVTKKIISYLGFQMDSSQLRIEVQTVNPL